MSVTRPTKSETETAKRESILVTHIRSCKGPLNAVSLARSYALTEQRVRDIIKRYGGSCG